MNEALGTVFYEEPEETQERLNSMRYDVRGGGATGQFFWNAIAFDPDELKSSFQLPEDNVGGYIEMCGGPFRTAAENAYLKSPLCETCIYEPAHGRLFEAERDAKVKLLGLVVKEANSPYSSLVRDASRRENAGLRYVLVGTTRAPKRSTTDAGQEEALRAARVLATSIQRLLPGMSEEALGRLVGVSRITWRDWIRGASAPRAARRRRLLRLKKVLELRRRVAPTESLPNWLETPVGLDLNVTPARLLSENRDQVVAILAARARAPEGDEFTLDAPLDLGGLVDPERVREELEMRHELVEENPEM